MGSKGDVARQNILRAAQALFAQKGYGSVTMQDICRKTGLSRGGLYRYYASTGEIFIAIIENEQARALELLERARERGITPTRMLSTFLRSRLTRLIGNEDTFDNAISEFAAESEAGRAVLVARAEGAVSILTGMIEDGCRAGEFVCGDPRGTAAHILWLLEGMAKHHSLIPLSREDVEAQIRLINSLLH